MSPQPNQMQSAFIKAAEARLGTQGGGKWVDRVVRVADRVKVRDPRETIHLSFRTAQKLKADGVIA